MSAVVKAVQYLNSEEIEAAGNPAGAYCFRLNANGTFAGMAFICPCGCGHECWVAIGDENPHPRWTWNGDKDKPTLKPSIFNTGLPCRWHGWLTDGEFRSV